MGTAVKLLNLQRNSASTGGPPRAHARSASGGEDDFHAQLRRHQPADHAATSSGPASHGRNDPSTESSGAPADKNKETPPHSSHADPSADDGDTHPSQSADKTHPSGPQDRPAAQTPPTPTPAENATDSPIDPDAKKKKDPAGVIEARSPAAQPLPAATAVTPASPPQDGKTADAPRAVQESDADAPPTSGIAQKRPVSMTTEAKAAAASGQPSAGNDSAATKTSPLKTAPSATPQPAAASDTKTDRPKPHPQAEARRTENADRANSPQRNPAAAAPQAKEASAEADSTVSAADASMRKLKPAGESDAGHSVQSLLRTDAPKSPSAAAAPASPTAAAAPRPEARFVETNHPNLISSIRNQLLPGGGTMHLRLDPPELGAMQVTVRMNKGVMTASFETSSDQAARLLSHSLHQLKDVLESQGVQVDKLQVRQQTIRQPQHTGDGSNPQQQGQGHSAQQQQQQQRRDLMRRMWAKFALGDQPLDITG